MKKDLLNLTIEEMEQFAVELGEKSYRGKQVFQWIHRDIGARAASFEEMTNLPKAFRTKLEESARIGALELLDAQEDQADGTRKFLFGAEQGTEDATASQRASATASPGKYGIESVFMKYSYGNTLCVSTQIGCKMGCSFCASALGGFIRDLTAGEMMGQVLAVERQTDVAAYLSKTVEEMCMGEIGQAMYRNKDYANSLSYFESAYDTVNWSNSYKEIRTEWMSTYFLALILIIVAIIALVLIFFRCMNKINRKAATSGKKKTFGQEIAYGFYVIFHPFDGFWDLKHEKRGSIRGSIFFIVLTIGTFCYQAIGQGYLLNQFDSLLNVWDQLLGVLVPLFLFVLSNWCLTTLFGGEGSFKDVFIATSYCLVPLPLLIIPATIYSNFCISTETDIVGFIGTLAFIWLGMLIFFGTMVTHDYSMGKNVITVLGTVVAMVFIMFIAVLFTTLIGKIVSLITNIVTEIQYRI